MSVTCTHTDTPDGTRGTRGLPYIRELISSRVRRRSSNQHPQTPSTELGTTPHSELVVTPHSDPDCIKSGKLLKTSKVRSENEVGPVKNRRFRFKAEQRFFRLTEDALEYYQTFNQVSKLA